MEQNNSNHCIEHLQEYFFTEFFPYFAPFSKTKLSLLHDKKNLFSVELLPSYFVAYLFINCLLFFLPSTKPKIQKYPWISQLILVPPIEFVRCMYICSLPAWEILALGCKGNWFPTSSKWKSTAIYSFLVEQLKPYLKRSCFTHLSSNSNVVI